MVRPVFPHSKAELAMEAWSCGLGENGLGLRVRQDANDGSNGPDIGDRRRSCVNLMPIGMGIVWPLTGAPVILLVILRPMRPVAMPPIGIPIGAMIILVWVTTLIWVGLGTQGV
jgi:hypothetical protein